MPRTAAAAGTGTASRGAGPGAAHGADVAKFLHGQGNTREQVHAQLRRNGHSEDDAAKITGAEFDPAPSDDSKAPGPATPEKAPHTPPKGARSGSRPGNRPTRGRHVSAGPVSVPVPGTPAGILLALVLYPAGLAALKGGPQGLKNWFSAKFFNKPAGSAGAANSAWSAPSASVANAINASLATSGAGATGSGIQTTAYTTGGASGAVAPVLSYALAQVGKPYVWAGAGPNGFDCSGLTKAAYATIGESLPHSSALQSVRGSKVSGIGAAAPGDLIFPYFPVTHVAIYLGGGQVVEAANPSTGVRVTNYYGAAGGIRRIV